MGFCGLCESAATLCGFGVGCWEPMSCRTPDQSSAAPRPCEASLPELPSPTLATISTRPGVSLCVRNHVRDLRLESSAQQRSANVPNHQTQATKVQNLLGTPQRTTWRCSPRGGAPGARPEQERGWVPKSSKLCRNGCMAQGRLAWGIPETPTYLREYS